MGELTYARRLSDPWSNALPDDPRQWSAEQVSAALYDESLRHPAHRLLDRAARRGVVVDERAAIAAVLGLDDGDPWEWAITMRGEASALRYQQCPRCRVSPGGFCGSQRCDDIPF